MSTTVTERVNALSKFKRATGAILTQHTCMAPTALHCLQRHDYQIKVSEIVGTVGNVQFDNPKHALTLLNLARRIASHHRFQ